MNPIPAVLAFASFAAAPAPVAQGEARHPPPELRRTVQQYPRGSEPAPRELTQLQRAELRRQLTEFAPLPAQRRR